MKKDDFTNYIGQLIDNPEVDDKILGELGNVTLLLSVYRAGLQGHDFPVLSLLSEVSLEDVPLPFHPSLAQMMILKSGEGGRIKGYLVDRLIRELESYKSFFTLP